VEEAVTLEESVITATRSPRSVLELPYSTTRVSEQTIRERSYRTTPQVLRDIPGIFVQETAPGHGSPYIRGFTSFRNLFLIDGIRLNNSVFRPGPNQYWNTVDPLSLGSLEVVKGPSSVLYGSDAIGGTVNARTRDPWIESGGRTLAASLFYRYSSAESSNVGRAQVSGALSDDLAVVLGVGGKDFGTLEAGDPTGKQPNTGYSELDADVKLDYFLDPNTRLVFGFQHVYQNEVPRTHRTVYAVPFEGTTVGTDLRRDFDQERNLAYVQVHGADLDGFIDRYDLNLSYHGQDEVRNRTRGSGVQEVQGFEVATLGLFANLGSDTDIGRLTYGFDLYHDDVDSFSSTDPIQGPVGDDSTYDLLGVYVQDEIEATDRLDFILGARFNYARAEVDSFHDPVTDAQASLDEDWSAFVGSARFLYELSKDSLSLFGGISQAFRAPNLSDLTRLDAARSNEFEIPSPDLDPERTLSYELGVKSQSESLTTEVAVFYTQIEDSIVRFPTGDVMGADTVVTKDNVGDGYMWGLEAGASWELVPRWTLFGNAAYQYGKVDTYPTSAQVEVREYKDRLMPFMAQLGLRWDSETSRFWAEGMARYADEADKLSTRNQNDTSRIPPGGTPSYLVLDLRGGWRVNESATLLLGLENLTDEDYRVHGSGHNMPGRGLVAGLELAF